MRARILMIIDEKYKILWKINRKIRFLDYSGFGFCDMILGFGVNSGFGFFDTILGFGVQGLGFAAWF
jgi:hypothetical protein